MKYNNLIEFRRDVLFNTSDLSGEAIFIKLTHMPSGLTITSRELIDNIATGEYSEEDKWFLFNEETGRIRSKHRMSEKRLEKLFEVVNSVDNG